MDHFPIFLSLKQNRVVLSGGGEAAKAKLRLLLKTSAKIEVFAEQPDLEITEWARTKRLRLVQTPLTAELIKGAALFYAANEDASKDHKVAALARSVGVLVNIVDNLQDSQFITPAIVDRDPVTVAIGTEGTAPVLARAIKADIETRLPSTVGILARLANSFRSKVEVLPFGRKRREFWSEFFFSVGPRALADGGEERVKSGLVDLLDSHQSSRKASGHVAFVGSGPGDPELLTLKARKALDTADVVIYDRLVGAPILELARREAILINAGKEGFGASTCQKDINTKIVEHAASGAQVLRLKGGDATVFGRLDEEIEACEAAGISWHIVPGITAASASVAAIGQSMTRRGRNTSVRYLTGHDMRGFADHDWADLAKKDTVAAIYMGKKSARFIQGRLLMHGAERSTPVTIVENASSPDQRILEATLDTLPHILETSNVSGPALTLYGLAPRAAEADLITTTLQEFA
ncbi:MAG: siroheme synthase CysG [Paracoccaceae bacterium]